MFPKVTVPKTFSLKYLRRGTVLSNITKKGKVYLFIFLKLGKFFQERSLSGCFGDQYYPSWHLLS